MENTATAFTNACADLVRRHVLPDLHRFLTERSKTTSAPPSLDDLLAWFEASSGTKSRQTAVPAYLAPAQAATNSTTTSKRARSRGARATNGKSEYGKCQYEYKRAPRKGEKCDSDAIGPEGYCRPCLRKESVRAKLQKTSNGANGAEHVQAPVIDDGTSTPSVRRVAVRARQLPDGFFVEDDHKFLFTKAEGGHVVHAVRDNGVDRALTEAEKSQAAAIGMRVDPSYLENKKTVTSTAVITGNLTSWSMPSGVVNASKGPSAEDVTNMARALSTISSDQGDDPDEEEEDEEEEED